MPRAEATRDLAAESASVRPGDCPATTGALVLKALFARTPAQASRWHQAPRGATPTRCNSHRFRRTRDEKE